MQAPRKISRQQAANDQRPRKALRTVSVVTLNPPPKNLGRILSGGVLFIGVSLLAASVWLTHKEISPTPLLVARAPSSSQPPAKLADIALPASSLSPDAPLPDDGTVNIVASKLADLPALGGKDMLHTSSADEDLQSIVARAQALLESEEYDEAINLYNQALAMDKGHHAALTGKAFALAKNGETDQAIIVEQQVLKLYPHDDSAAANLGHMLMQTGENATAITYLDRAAREAPDRLAYRLDLAVLYDRTSHRDEAVMLYRQIIDSAADNEIAAARLSAIQQRVDYLETIGAAAIAPSTTEPVDN